jgi:predicted alpha/beta hydrolase family esterase
MKVIILHGANGNPHENWFMWLKSELEKHSIESIVPRLPIDETQSYASWGAIVDPIVENGDVIIGHSLGGLFWLNYLKCTNKNLRATHLIATPNPLLDEFNPGNDSIFKNKILSFSQKEKLKAGEVVVYESNNDPYIPEGIGKDISKLLNGEYIHIPNSGHFNEYFGYDTFPDLLKSITKHLT